MTIDITIGRLKFKSVGEVIKERLDEMYTVSNEETLSVSSFLDIEQCPDASDGCTQKDTISPNSAYRSGSITGMSNFFAEVMPVLIKRMRPICSNDSQFTKIKPFIDEINKLEYKGKTEQHKQRLHWFKFWCNKAVELYDEEAGILFN